MNIEINRQYLFGSALGGFFGYMVSSQLIFFHPSQAFWLVGFGGVGGYAIAENVDLKKQREKGWRDHPFFEDFKKCSESHSKMMDSLDELFSALEKDKAEKLTSEISES